MLVFVVAFAPAVVNPILMAKVKARGRRRHARQGRRPPGEQRPADPLPSADRARRVRDRHGAHLRPGLRRSTTPGCRWPSSCGWPSSAVVIGVLLPAERKLAAGDLDAEKKVAMGGQIVTVLTLVMLYLMIWKPGAVTDADELVRPLSGSDWWNVPASGEVAGVPGERRPQRCARAALRRRPAVGVVPLWGRARRHVGRRAGRSGRRRAGRGGAGQGRPRAARPHREPPAHAARAAATSSASPRTRCSPPSWPWPTSRASRAPGWRRA